MPNNGKKWDRTHVIFHFQDFSMQWKTKIHKQKTNTIRVDNSLKFIRYEIVEVVLDNDIHGRAMSISFILCWASSESSEIYDVFTTIENSRR